MILVFIFLAFLSFPHKAFADNGDIPPSSSIDFTAASDLSPNLRSDLERFYALRGDKPAWDLSDEESLKRIQAFIDSVSALITYHGLDESAYPLEVMRQLAKTHSPDDRLRLELLISASLLRLASDLHGDTVDLDTIYTGWHFHRQSADIPALLNVAASKGALGDFFARIIPQGQAYRSLSSTLQIYHALAARGGWQKIASGPALHPHDRSPRIAQARARLMAEDYLAASSPGDDNYFDDELEKALITYQTRTGLSPDGALGGKTLEALNVPIAVRIAQIRANMERWRHMPDDYPPERYTQINIPDFSIVIVEDGKEAYRGIVIDGRPDRQTPFISSTIVNMLINPSWHVPAKLARKDILPKLRKDPHYLEKLGFVIAGREEDPAGTQIDWKHVDPANFPYQLRQTPSDLNSLGQLKFNFVNAFDVYMHGTPHQELFEKAERDFSSGCVRLEDPLRVGEIFLSSNKDGGGWDVQRLNDAISTGKTQFVGLAKPMPVYFLYWSVFSGDDGRLNFRKDVYGYDTLLTNKMSEIGPTLQNP